MSQVEALDAAPDEAIEDEVIEEVIPETHPEPADETEPQVVEGTIEPVDDAEDAPEAPAEATIAKGGLGRWFAERRAQLGGIVDGWVDNRFRVDLARKHIAEERDIARVAASRLPADASRAQLVDMMGTVRAERAEAATLRAAAEQKTRDLAEAARLEKAAADLERTEAKIHRPAFADHKARYDQLQPQTQAAWQGMQETSQAGQIALSQAREARERAAALRAQYEESAPATEPAVA